MNETRMLTRSLAAVGLAVGLLAMPPLARASIDGLPDGSWRQSCQGGSVRDGKLYAVCMRDGGKKSEMTSVAIDNCRAFGNRNGKLFCESAGGGSSLGPWSGSFLQSCRDASIDKQGKLQAMCRKPNGTYKRSNLQAQKCPGFRAGNRDGDLVCESNGSTGGVSQWGGSFSQSCRDVSTGSNGVLTATCQTMNGRWNRTSLSPAQCSGRLAGNRDGTLFCEAEGVHGGSRPWRGSFSQSCRDASTDSSGVLTATCQTATGRWNRTSLSPAHCTGRKAGNREGTLFCEAEGVQGGAGQWRGSFSESCRDLATDVNGVLTASCQTATGRWNRTTLSPAHCSGYKAGNRDGTLFCEAEGVRGGAGQWRGSFSESCRDLATDSNGVLTADCQTTIGRWNRTSLSPAQCRGRKAGNRDGTLVCEQ
jgi:hypothetical protein